MFEFTDQTPAEELREIHEKALDFLANTNDELSCLEGKKIEEQQQCLGKPASAALKKARQAYGDKLDETLALEGILERLKLQYVKRRRQEAQDRISQLNDEAARLSEDIKAAEQELCQALADVEIALEKLHGTGNGDTDRLSMFELRRWLANYGEHRGTIGTLVKEKRHAKYEGYLPRRQAIDRECTRVAALTADDELMTRYNVTKPVTDNDLLKELEV